MLGLPLAGPALIACLYLAVAWDLKARRPRRAATTNAALLAALAAWPLLLILDTGGFQSWAGAGAALLAPLFAAAPALVRLATAGDAGPERSAAIASVACLDRLAPARCVLIADRAGTLLAATRSARAALGLGTKAEGDLCRLFEMPDRPLLLDAIVNAREGAGPVEVVLRRAGAGEGEARFDAGIRAENTATVSVTLERNARGAAAGLLPHARDDTGEAARNMHTAAPVGGTRCDVGEAIAFSLGRAESMAAESGIAVSADPCTGIFADCDRQTCRRIAGGLIRCAVESAGPGGSVAVLAREIRGAVLIRAVSERAEDTATGAARVESMAGLQAAVDAAGGTLVAEGTRGEMRFSVRLGRAAA
jgi:hypothetical protein